MHSIYHAPAIKYGYVRHQRAPESLLAFLLRRFPYHALQAWQQRIDEHFVQINGVSALPEQVLQSGDWVTYHRPKTEEPEVDTTHRLLYQDEALLAVEKSGNIPSAPGGLYWHHCLLHLLQNRYQDEQIRVVHRLDRETSGVNLFARNRFAAKMLGDDFANQTIRKTYVAVLWGTLTHKVVVVNSPLKKSDNSLVWIRQAPHPEGRPSETRFYAGPVLTDKNGSKATLVHIELMSGRTHQIRVHAELLGHSVVGDKIYGQADAGFLKWFDSDERWLAPRQLLHAQRIGMLSPVTQRTLRIESDGIESLTTLFESGVYTC